MPRESSVGAADESNKKSAPAAWGRATAGVTTPTAPGSRQATETHRREAGHLDRTGQDKTAVGLNAVTLVAPALLHPSFLIASPFPLPNCRRQHHAARDDTQAVKYRNEVKSPLAGTAPPTPNLCCDATISVTSLIRRRPGLLKQLFEIPQS